MQLTKRGEYALRTLIRLGIAHELGRELVSVSELAQAERLPLKFVEQILLQLRGAGYIETRRGKFGGYSIAKPTKKIRIADVIRLIDGKLAPIACASETCYARCSCPDEEHCGLRMLMIDVRNAIVSILERYTLHDVIEVTLRKIRRDGLPAPFGVPALEPLFRPSSKSRRHADPRDGFLALLNEDESWDRSSS
jgi:Rrf2 family protein